MKSGLHQIAHQAGEHVVGVIGMVHLDLQQGTGIGVKGGFPKLIGVHFPKTLIALDGQTPAAGIHHRGNKIHGPTYCRCPVPTGEGSRC